MTDSSQMPKLAEPWFLTFNAEVHFKPVMSPQDLAKGSSGITKAVEKYAK
jgi:hypothetical protein